MKNTLATLLAIFSIAFAWDKSVWDVPFYTHIAQTSLDLSEKRGIKLSQEDQFSFMKLAYPDSNSSNDAADSICSVRGRASVLGLRMTLDSESCKNAPFLGDFCKPARLETELARLDKWCNARGYIVNDTAVHTEARVLVNKNKDELETDRIEREERHLQTQAERKRMEPVCRMLKKVSIYDMTNKQWEDYKSCVMFGMGHDYSNSN
jgi:hypothetical protein